MLPARKMSTCPTALRCADLTTVRRLEGLGREVTEQRPNGRTGRHSAAVGAGRRRRSRSDHRNIDQHLSPITAGGEPSPAHRRRQGSARPGPVSQQLDRSTVRMADHVGPVPGYGPPCPTGSSTTPTSSTSEATPTVSKTETSAESPGPRPKGTNHSGVNTQMPQQGQFPHAADTKSLNREPVRLTGCSPLREWRAGRRDRRVAGGVGVEVSRGSKFSHCPSGRS